MKSLVGLGATLVAALGAYGLVSLARAEETEGQIGKAVFIKANCVGCHKWHGNGGGGYGGAALSLRKTQLDRDQIIMTVTCGRPGTGMPSFLRGVYDDSAKDHPCYGYSQKDLTGDNHVAEAGVFLRPSEIEAVADYVIKHIKGHGEPNLAECKLFFGDKSRVCDVYETQHTHKMPTPSTIN